MLDPNVKPRNFSGAVIGHLESLTESFLRGNLLSIIPLFVWIAIAAFLWLTVERKAGTPTNQTNVVIQQDDKDSRIKLPRWNRRRYFE